MEKLEYLNQPNCLKLSNGVVDAIVTTDVGPRIVHYGFAGGENMLGAAPDAALTTSLGEWKAYGGHRLWAAPENDPRSYVPDNAPIDFEELGENSVRLIQPVEEATGIQKEMAVTLDEDGALVTVAHKITNHNLWAVDLAAWGLTIMNGEGGGTVILPQEPYKSHDEALLPARVMVVWHYTDLSDPRWTLGRKYILLEVDAALAEPQKVGIADKQGWAAYARNKTLFVKRFAYNGKETYPDCGCNCEAYTAGAFVELETLGPMQHLEPGEAAEHIERWQLFADVQLGDNEVDIEAALTPLL